jgi:hypothetical protein
MYEFCTYITTLQQRVHRSGPKVNFPARREQQMRYN